MAILGTLLKNRRAGEAKLAWNLPALAGPQTLGLRSGDFVPDGTIPLANAGRRAGGQNLSPALSWTGTPEDTAQLLLVVEDIDAPTSSPFVHCVALIDPGLDALPAGALNAERGTPGVQVLRSGMGRGYLGPEPIKGHGVHRYVFQIFALRTAVTAAGGGATLDSARPRAVLAGANGPVLARGRLDGRYAR
ncbi:YbhB/YbcL family Raf kinase inhibitor-like protein [Streptacidiphilus sp. 4-A2]|nr:YbhB/YbcL family Raf kinase inhibitor-like protein [Streptacidiphilus sp. 4-A2]